MKFRIGSLFLFILMVVCVSQSSAKSIAGTGKGIQFFEGSFEALKARAMAEKKLLFFF